METKPIVTRFPSCRALDIISYPKGEPRVLVRDLKNALRPSEWDAWCQWSDGITRDELGIYAWDVEAFLTGQPNVD
jgi:hypothetical protein